MSSPERPEISESDHSVIASTADLDIPRQEFQVADTCFRDFPLIYKGQRAVRFAQNLSIMHDPTAQYSKMSLEHIEEGNPSSCTTDLCNDKLIPPSTHNLATRPLCNSLCQNLRRACIYFYDHIVLLSLPRHYLYRIRFVQEATGPQPRGQSGLIVRDEAATHAMERLCIQAWILHVCAQVFAAYGWW